jgi:hypothetical protein
MPCGHLLAGHVRPALHRCLLCVEYPLTMTQVTSWGSKKMPEAAVDTTGRWRPSGGVPATSVFAYFADRCNSKA